MIMSFGSKNMNDDTVNRKFRPIRLLLLLFLSCSVPMHALVITGDVYGGGKDGKVGTQEVDATTSVTINSGDIRTVYGGGQNGMLYGTTSVTISGGTIGATKWTDSPYGGVFGGGEGSNATVYGTGNVTISGGTIINNVYGGGKEAQLNGNANVHITGGIMDGSVFAGAKMANILGRAYLWIEGSENELILSSVYGGNDISGSMQKDLNVVSKPDFTFGVTEITADDNWKNWNSFIRVTGSGKYPIIGNLYGGGNGDYEYGEDGSLVMDAYQGCPSDKRETFYDLSKPVIERTYLDLTGGFYGYVYGGGNNATVTERTDIYFNRPLQAEIPSLTQAQYNKLHLSGELEGVDYTISNGMITPKNHVSRMFGGNNKTEMNIRPTWHLISGTIGDLYSGGNQGSMTNSQGIYLSLNSANMIVGNMYGGCRLADVNPANANLAAETLDGYSFDAGYAAKVLVKAGNVQNVYGGNDISGSVKYGTYVQIRGIVNGDVYGGGNGSYAYTDQTSWVTNHAVDADYYYNPGVNSILALNAFRPNVEKSLVHIEGDDVNNPAIVGGSVYCGGNSATITEDDNTTAVASANFKIGKNIRLNNTFLGSNGVNMTDATILSKYADSDFSSLNLTDAATFATYMEGASLDIMPNIEWSWDENTETVLGANAYIGSFYCGGNVGNLNYAGSITLNFPNQLTIFTKIVGGCNTANIPAGENNAERIGGVTVANSGDNAGTPKITLNVRSFLEPRILSLVKNGDFVTSASLDWSTTTFDKNGNSISILTGANIYGGCYSSGIVNGDVAINIPENLISPTIYTDDKYYISENSPLGDYVYSTALNVFGGGYGENTEIRGNTIINVSDRGRVMKVFGGGEMGVVSGNTQVTMAANLTIPDGVNDYNIYKVYGGGLQGNITGGVSVLLEGGKLMDAFGGSCVANIDGSTFVKVGDVSRVGDGNNLFVKGNIYGGNDLGGSISGNTLYTNLGNEGKSVRTQTLVRYQSGVISGNIFGAANGAYDYNSIPQDQRPSVYPKQDALISASGDEIVTNSFVLVESPSVKTDKISGSVFGGGQGYAGYMGLVDTKQTYVRLASSGTYANRTTNGAGALVENVYGGGYYSFVDNTRVDAERGYYNTIYGGTVGQTHADLATNISYDCNNTVVNVYDGIENTAMQVFGAGAMTGVNNATNVNLYGGNVGYVYGGSYQEGGCLTTNVTIPTGSTFKGKAVYGGSVGSSDDLPCDVETSNVTLSSTTSYLSEGVVFGGNRNYRATNNTNITLAASMRNAAAGDYLTIYGAGDGEHTIAGHTNVNIRQNTIVKAVYGAARNGKVYNRYNNKAGADTYYSSNGSDYSHWDYSTLTHNTQINLNVDSRVIENVYGGGYGENATVSGTTGVKLIGGTVDGDIYGGGYSGSVSPLTNESIGFSSDMEASITNEIIGTFNDIIGGRVRNVYGGCYAGAVNGETNVNIGLRKTPAGQVLLADGSTYSASTFAWGKPVVQRSVYGGGEKGRVSTSNVNMNDGYVGYDYNAATNEYTQKLTLNASDQTNLLKENGNMYGGGYGEGAVTIHTNINVYDGVIRNGLYGGGEIASVGYAKVIKNGRDYSLDNSAAEVAKRENGETKVNIYGGLIEGDVFGGGRGFSYNTEGAMLLGDHYYSDGFVFGSTEVALHRGTIGTDITIDDGHGNVFGGGNVGYIFSLEGTKSNGYYYKNGQLTEDCKVTVTPYCVAKEAVTINGVSYVPGDLVPPSSLNTLVYNDARWSKLDDLGINIRNAIFAGGNVTQGTDIVYADAKTVFGNVTASVVDINDCDFITIGDDGVGGLYGDGNLTLVDGYRELNVTNYGTDYNHLDNSLSYNDYKKLHARKKAYYELKYGCIEEHYYTDSKNKNHHYLAGDQISGSVYEKMTTAEQEKWELKGFATLYAGRLMNTIQRTDFCGIFGSRIVLKGARDRVTSLSDYTDYTLNRVGELSLNKIGTQGCYFGIYNVVNLLGGLTSDVDFYSVRTSDNSAMPADGSTTFDQWKSNRIKDKYRNNGSASNVVALASGVWLEIIKGENAGQKDYGYITGVVQLDLVKVSSGEGGGYVYAKNEHRPRQLSGLTNVTLSDANNSAVSNKLYTYSGTEQPFETSGNFVHSLKQIVDDCFPNNGSYVGEDASAAHYWYIRGDYYVYNQMISAYTGFSQAYPKSVDIPLTITSGANGQIEIESIADCKYAYFVGMERQGEVLEIGDSIQIGTEYYKLNDPISNWAYERLSEVEQDFFTDQTYVCINDVLNYEGKPLGVAGDLGSMAYKKEDVIDQAIFNTLGSTMIIVDNPDVPNQTKQVSVASFFRKSNSISFDNGFLLTLEANNPERWDEYYTQIAGNEQKLKSEYEKLQNKSDYFKSPSFLCNADGTYGQRDYVIGDVVDKDIFDLQTTLSSDINAAGMTLPSGQAVFKVAYVAKEDVHVWTTSANGETIDMFVTPGNVISSTDYNRSDNMAIRSKFETGYLCINSLIDNDPQILYGEVIPQNQYDELENSLKGSFSPAYYCTESGKYGGKLYRQNINYQALDWNSLNQEDRSHFTFNKDALDLIAQDFDDIKNGNYNPTVDPERYSSVESINYEAQYKGNNPIDISDILGGIKNIEGTSLSEIVTNTILDNENFEKLPNERRHYSLVTASADDVNNDSTIYMVKETFRIGDIFYNIGKIVRPAEYSTISSDYYNFFDTYRFSSPASYYICKEPYNTLSDITPLEADGSNEYSSESLGSQISVNSVVPVGTVLNVSQYTDHVINKQSGFDIMGITPQEVTTLYVARDADIRELSEDKIITVVMKYTYLESDFEGNNFEEINERHVLNIRIHFESGVPTIGNIQAPGAVLPGSAVGMTQPKVIPGAYEILGGGWDIFTNEEDAYAHKNGTVYDNSRAPLYWFQNGYWIAYYTKSYLGKTYSNPVPLTVANYHRMESVFNHPEHLYIDSVYVKAGVKAMARPAKIYIDDHACTDNTMNELDYLYEFFTDSLTIAGDVVNNKPVTTLNSQVKDAKDLIFIIQSDMSPKKYSNWTSIGSNGHSFIGELRGDGHTLKNLNNSLFGYFDGKVYNLGVQGSFTGSGIADAGSNIGYAENCWVETSGRQGIQLGHADYNVRPVLGSGTIVNSYYIVDEYQKTHAEGDANAATPLEFLDGTVSYNLNGFYLQKRADIETGDAYRVNSDGTALEKMTSTSESDNYVESTIGDGDFRFAKGVMTNIADVRYDADNNKYYPIYPDDFIFFGQTLSYGGVQGKDQDGTPEKISKLERTFIETIDDEQILHKVDLIDFTTTAENRVFQALGYYLQNDGSLTKRGILFNKDASFIDKFYWKIDYYDIDNNLVAIDFTGKNDVDNLLDYNGLNSINSQGITRNLLIYADPSDQSYSILNNAANEPGMNEGGTYHNITEVIEANYPLFHLVDKQNDGTYSATSDHFLVDKQNFAAPISYTFGTKTVNGIVSDCKMWYQREPSTFANGTGNEAWEGIVLPFTAEKVTASDKGEVTHFYNNEATGHEYWLRGFTGVADSKASYIRPNSNPGESGYDSRYAIMSDDYTVSNSYLWDYYYNKNSRKDNNSDAYQQYYSNDRVYSNYVLATKNIPYIVAFPGAKYMEFDMSGTFVAQNTATPAPAKLNPQVITFVSKSSQQIDSYSLSNLTTSIGNYTYQGTFTNVSPSQGTVYSIDANGHGFETVSNDFAAVPFRTYLSYTAVSPAPTKALPSYIPIGNDADYDVDDELISQTEGLDIYVKNGAIHIVSSLNEDVTVNIYSAAGQLIREVKVSAGAHVTVSLNAHGIYLVNKKKLVI